MSSGGSYKVVCLFFLGLYVFVLLFVFIFVILVFYDCTVKERSRRQYLNTKFYHRNH